MGTDGSGMSDEVVVELTPAEPVKEQPKEEPAEPDGK